MFHVAPASQSVVEPSSTTSLPTVLFTIAIVPNRGNDQGSYLSTASALLRTVTERNIARVGGSAATLASMAASHGELIAKIAARGWIIVRRYSEIAQFRRWLTLKYLGACVPQLPQKSSGGSSSDVGAEADSENIRNLQTFFDHLSRFITSSAGSIALQNQFVAEFLVAPRVYDKKMSMMVALVQPHVVASRVSAASSDSNTSTTTPAPASSSAATPPPPLPNFETPIIVLKYASESSSPAALPSSSTSPVQHKSNVFLFGNAQELVERNFETFKVMAATDPAIALLPRFVANKPHSVPFMSEKLSTAISSMTGKLISSVVNGAAGAQSASAVMMSCALSQSLLADTPTTASAATATHAMDNIAFPDTYSLAPASATESSLLSALQGTVSVALPPITSHVGSEPIRFCSLAALSARACRQWSVKEQERQTTMFAAAESLSRIGALIAATGESADYDMASMCVNSSLSLRQAAERHVSDGAENSGNSNNKSSRDRALLSLETGINAMIEAASLTVTDYTATSVSDGTNGSGSLAAATAATNQLKRLKANLSAEVRHLQAELEQRVTSQVIEHALHQEHRLAQDVLQ